MRRWAPAAAALLIAGCGGERAPRPTQQPASTVAVQRGALASTLSLNGTLAFRARPDGAPYAAVNQAQGIYTRLPAEGDRVDCGEVLYRVDDDPVLLVCGPVPAYRALRPGARGNDVRQLNRTLRGVDDARFSARTKRALQRRQRRTGARATGRLALGDAVVLPRAARIAKVSAKIGGPARPGAEVAQATSATLEVHVSLDPTQRDAVKPGDRARVTLPDNTVAEGTLGRLGKVARTDDDTAGATIPATIRLDEPRQARGLDQAPVRVELTTEGVEDALSVPVTAIVGKAGGGFAVELVRADGRSELVAVRLGLFDTAGGRVAVAGAVAAGDRVVVPAS